jgi:predicted metal-dependent hydrolase
MAFIILNNKKYSYEVFKKPISSIRLRLKSNHSFIISCPYLAPQFVINRFIRNNQNWITHHSQKISPKKSIKNLKKITILNHDYQIIFVKTQSDSVIIFEKDQKIYVNISKITNLHIKKVLEKKLRPFALSLIKKELINLQKQFGFKYNHVTVRNQSSRFGSCSSRGNLNFNWQIILFPVENFRHILLHELTHLDIKNHSSKFWDQLTIYDPDCKSNNLWLKKQGTKLFLF